MKFAPLTHPRPRPSGRPSGYWYATLAYILVMLATGIWWLRVAWSSTNQFEIVLGAATAGAVFLLAVLTIVRERDVILLRDPLSRRTPDPEARA